MKPENCFGLKDAKTELIKDPVAVRVECQRENCMAIIGYSKSGKRKEPHDKPHIVGGIPRCSTIEVNSSKISQKLARVYFPISQEMETQLKEEYELLAKEAEELGIS